MGFRLAIAMGYHHHDAKLRAGPAQSSADIARRETCRRAFWGAFLLDRYTAIGGGKALGINDDDITVLLPLRDKDWQNRSAAPPLSALEFFRPVGPASLSAGRSASVGGAANVAGGGFASRGSSSGTGGFDSDVSSPLTGTSTGSRNSTPTSPTGWDTRLGDVGALGQFIKLMTVVGQVAQHVNGSKGAASPGRRAPLRERPSRGCTMLDAALLRWKEELPPWLSCAEARSADARPEAAVFVLCMHAIYYGAVIMLNRENMGLLRDLPGQLDVSTNLAIRSLERCRVAAMEVVEISHHICSLPSAMTNALLPWALFQAGTLLIHFMIAGSSAQAQEEARAAILSLDCALRDELSRYWSVSSKYHLVLSNMVKAWERARQATPSLTPRQLSGTPGVAGQLQPPLLQVQALAGPVSSESASEAFQAFSTQFQLPMQMQHVPPHMAAALQPRKAEHQSQRQPASGEFATLMKPYAAPASSTARDPAVPAGVLSLRASSTQSAGSSAAHRSAEQRGGAASDKAVGSDPALLPGFVFSADTAQDSLNTLNAFFSQLSQEQARQFSEGLQMYALHGGRSSGAQAEAEPIAADVMLARAPSLPLAAPMEHLQPAAAFDLAGQSHGDSSSSNRHQYSRRDSLPISSNCDLFTAPGEHHLFSASTIQSDRSISASFGQIAGDVLMSSELDPLLFNPMTPFLQELQMFNSPHLHAPSSADTRSAGRPTHSSAGRTDAPSSS
ncbi:hypothetical protein LPJ61_001265 [Coemansia biformis]|uniref:Xylanolytic transcriptional activator regulatory domain-containing protein n=1 Tax=Coemansia biformis TaxID=1286918 RepID=A0A9W8CXG4_9FUNG|nr:hypothetical protein LPJ61_001265 [Coemansia biformis]